MTLTDVAQEQTSGFITYKQPTNENGFITYISLRVLIVLYFAAVVGVSGNLSQYSPVVVKF